MENANVETVRTVEVAGSEANIQSARNLTEAERGKWAPWFAAVALYSVSDVGLSVALSLNLREVSDVLGRHSTHQFPGCNNRVWIISEAEEAALIAADATKAAKVAEIEAARDAEEVPHSATCPRCGTHCYGDCTAL